VILAQHVTWAGVIREDVAPVLSGYLFFVAVLVLYRRSLRTGDRKAGAERRPFLRYLADVFLGGFAGFLSIVALFYFVVSGRPGTFLRHALVQGSELAFGIVLPAFLILTFAEDRVRRLVRRHRAGGFTA